MTVVAKMMKGLIFLYSQVLAEAGVLWVRGEAHLYKSHVQS